MPKSCESLPLALLLLLVLQHSWSLAAGGGLPQQLKAHQQQSLPQAQQQQQGHSLALHQQQQQPLQSQQQQQQQQQHDQYVHDKDEAMKGGGGGINSEEDGGDQYQMLHEPRLPPSASYHQWNPYAASLPPAPAQMPTAYSSMHPLSPFDNYAPPTMHTPRFLPLLGYPQPVFIPYPLYIAPEMFYPAFPAPASHDFDDGMARAANTGRRTAPAGSYPRNSPIYYVRMPPTPYMFLPGLGGYTSMASPPPPPPPPAASFGAGFASMLNSFQALPSLPAFSSVFNVPMNFLANGKPGGIYQMGAAPNDYQSALQFGGSRPPPPNPYRPLGGYFPQFGATGGGQQSASSQLGSPPQQQDSKLTALKRPFLFNGRPEDIYVLPNNFGPLYSSDSGYY